MKSVRILIAAALTVLFASCQWLIAAEVECTLGGDASCQGVGFCDPEPRDNGKHYCTGEVENEEWPPGDQDDDDTSGDDDDTSGDDDDTSGDDDDTSADDDDTSADDDDTSADDDDSCADDDDTSADDDDSAGDDDDSAGDDDDTSGDDDDPPADEDGDGFSNNVDCDDNNAAAYPNNPEVCDAADNNCDGNIDEDFDADGDGVTTCGPDGDSATTADNDCDDSTSSAHPGLSEQHPAGGTAPASACEDGYDNDCDGSIDCADGGCSSHSQCTLPIPDSDADGFGDHGFGGLDCNDFDDSVHPGAWDAQGDGVDSDCDGDDNTTSAAGSAVKFRPGCQASDAGYPFVVGAAGDFDDNGFPDLVFGSPYWSTSNCAASSSHVGRSHLWRSEYDSLPAVGQSVVLGSASGGRNLSGLSLTGDDPYSGFSVALNGDINNDGHDDLLIGVPGEIAADSSGNNTNYLNAGAVYLILGASSGAATNSQNTEALRPGSTQGNNQLRLNRADFTFFGFGENNFTGAAVAWAGDINNDGHDEILIGAPGWGAEGEGRVYLLDGARINSLMGSGTPHAQCQVVVYSGSTATTMTANNCRNLGDLAIGEHTIDGDAALAGYSGAFLGKVIAASRDLTGDGKPDFALGSTTANSNQGAVYVFFSEEMSPASTAIAPSPPPTLWDLFDATRSEGVSAVASADRHFEVTSQSSWQGHEFAKAVTLVPDLETDVLSDPQDSAELLIGMPAPNHPGNSRAFLIHGSDILDSVGSGSPVLTVPQSSSLLTFTGDASVADGFGSALAAGSVDADAIGDILICAPDTADGGRGYLFKGSHIGSGGEDISSANAVFVAESSGDHFCSSVALPGGASASNSADILIGAWSAGNGAGSTPGAAYLFQQ